MCLACLFLWHTYVGGEEKNETGLIYMMSCIEIEIKYTAVTKTEISNKIIVTTYSGANIYLKLTIWGPP
jgi:hypothetical protein